MSIAPFLAVQQCLYDVVKNVAINSQFGSNVSTFLLCGALAGTVAQTVSCCFMIYNLCQVFQKLGIFNDFVNDLSKKSVKVSFKAVECLQAKVLYYFSGVTKGRRG